MKLITLCNVPPLDSRARRLTFARIQAGYEDAVDFSRAFGIPQSTYALHETGQRDIRPNVAESYAAKLGNCSPEWLLYGKGPGPGHPLPFGADEGAGQISGETEEMAAFMLLYDRVAVATKDYEQAMQEEFGLIPRLFGFEADDRGRAQIAFYLWRQIANEKSNLTLTERVLGRLDFLEASMRELAHTLRKLGRAMKGIPPG